MSTRTPLTLLASALLVSFVAVNCTVTTTDGGDENEDVACDQGEERNCTCADGSKGVQVCSAARTRFNACVCDSGGGGAAGAAGTGAGASGDAGTAGEGTAGDGAAGASAGAGGTTDAGAGGAAEAGTGGAQDAGAGGTLGEAGSAGAAGEGGAVSCEPPGNPPDACDVCVFGQCCNETLTCLADSTCLDEHLEITGCVEDLRDEAVTPLEVRDCAEAVRGTTWPSGLSPLTVALWNCIAGAPANPNWVVDDQWAANACDDGCFSALPVE